MNIFEHPSETESRKSEQQHLAEKNVLTSYAEKTVSQQKSQLETQKSFNIKLEGTLGACLGFQPLAFRMDQHCPTELPEMMKMFYNLCCPMTDTSHVTPENLTCASTTKKPNLQFY